MEVIYGWVKNIVFFYIIMTAVLHLLPKNSYQKYVRFFGGIILVILLLTPLLELLYHPDYLLDKISYQSFLQDMNTMKLDVEGMEQTQKEIFFKEYEEAIANDIKTLSREDL